MLKRIIHFIGYFMTFIGVSMLLPLFIALAYSEELAAQAFLISILICFIPGMLLRTLSTTTLGEEKVSRRDSYLIVTLAWLTASLLGSFPYLLSESTDNFFHAFFESCSGFTTTGASVFTEIEHLPHAILMWRCFTQWLGGMGMIVLFTALLPGLGIKGLSISSAETPGPTETRLTAKYRDTARNIYLVYIALTLILFVLLFAGGMSPFDALAHAFATMATGGFSTHNAGLAFFNSRYIYFVIGIFAMLAGTNFALFFDVFAGRIKKVLEDEELVLYLTIIAVSTLLITASLGVKDVHSNVLYSMSHALFQAVNTLSTTGFLTGDVNWPSFCVLLLTFLMMIGGCSSSTAGGIKISRILIAFKIIKLELKSRTHENLIDDIKYDGVKVNASVLYHIYTYTSLFLMTIVAGTVMLSIFGGGSAQTNFLTIISCISSLGPGLDNLGLLCDYHLTSNISLLICNFVMIAGRLEITTMLIIFTRHFWCFDRTFD